MTYKENLENEVRALMLKYGARVKHGKPRLTKAKQKRLTKLLQYLEKV